MVDGSQSFARTQSGAIININKDELSSARSRKIQQKRKEREDKQLKADVETLQNEISDIKQLLTQIVEKI